MILTVAFVLCAYSQQPPTALRAPVLAEIPAPMSPAMHHTFGFPGRFADVTHQFFRPPQGLESFGFFPARLDPPYASTPLAVILVPHDLARSRNSRPIDFKSSLESSHRLIVFHCPQHFAGVILVPPPDSPSIHTARKW